MKFEDKIQVLIVDDHPMVQEGLRAMLQQLPFVQLAGIAGNAVEAIAILKNSPGIEVVLVDINLPEISGIELTAKIKKEFAGVKVLAMSTFNERSYVSQMIVSGAQGYVVKSASLEVLSEAILCVHEGKMFLSADVHLTVTESKAIQQQPLLTSREKEVLEQIAAGLTNPQIAAALFISQHTVESHRKNLLAKFGVNNTAGLIKLAARYGMV
ncbi:MAG: response regulator transcription factor [Chitinophagaceae bacterium]|jgi:DNA-binding NarL/FixJ family response regulator|nr:response regulator transcription factor [Chitinophagaceae bacterium]